MKIVLDSQEDTRKIAEKLASSASPGDCFGLYGDLGAGKTTFAKYFIKSLNSAIKSVPSPTFSLMQQYTSDKCDIIHIDFYRLISYEEAINTGFLEFIPDSISLIEWPEIIEDIIPIKLVPIRFSILGEKRIIEYPDE